MKLALSPDERQLQEDVRAFLAEHCPDPVDVPHRLDERMAYLRRWQAQCYEAGYVGRAWPAELGGGGRPTAEQVVVDQELAAVAIALPVGFVAASLLRRRRDHRIAGPILDFIVALPLSIPAVIYGVGFLMVYTNEPLVLYGTRWVLVLVYVTLMIPFSTRMQLGAMVALGDTYTEASRASGAGA